MNGNYYLISEHEEYEKLSEEEKDALDVLLKSFRALFSYAEEDFAGKGFAAFLTMSAQEARDMAQQLREERKLIDG